MTMIKTLIIKPVVIFKNAKIILKTVDDFINKDNSFIYHNNMNGFIQFNSGASSYDFNSIEELNEALVQENMDDLYIWSIKIDVYRKPVGAEYPNERVFHANVGFRSSSTIKIGIDCINSTESNRFIKTITKTLNCKLYKPKNIDQQDEAHIKKIKERDESIEKCISIFEKMPELQARIVKGFESEKEVQDFIYPILKSHFNDLQEEDYVSKMGPVASKPDFCIKKLGIAIEIKFINNKKTFKSLVAEINDDSRKYFTDKSYYSRMIVFIYNGASKPTPANFISDLENIEVISKVVISPNIIPGH